MGGVTSLDTVLAVDIGTSSIRAGLFDARGREVSPPVREAYDLVVGPDGKAEAGALGLVDLAVRSIDAALRRLPEGCVIAAVGFSTFWHSLLGIDAHGAPTTEVMTWADTRSAASAADLRSRREFAVFHQTTGCPLHASFWPAKLHWLKTNHPRQARRTRHWVSAADFIFLHLFGRLSTSISLASGTGLFEHHGQRWSEIAIESLGIDRASLPEITAAPYSGLAACYAERWPSLSDVPWYPAIGDGACSNVGAGCTDDSRIAFMLGTSGSMRILWEGRESAVEDPALWLYRLDERRLAGGMALAEGGNLVAWARRTLRLDGKPEEIELAISAMAPDTHGLTVLPFLVGERSPAWREDRTATIAGMTAATTPLHIQRAIMETVAVRFALLKERLDRARPGSRRIVATGSALLRSPAWLSMIADCLGQEIECSGVSEASLRGAAIVALERHGLVSSIGELDAPRGQLVSPRPEAYEAYQRMRVRHERLDHLDSREAPLPTAAGALSGGDVTCGET